MAGLLDPESNGIPRDDQMRLRLAAWEGPDSSYNKFILSIGVDM